MGNSYFNTNKERGETLKKSNTKAKTQEEEIEKIFKVNQKLSASEAWNIYNSDWKTPLTSIRRAITNLCNQGVLVKTDETKEGVYGKAEHIYRVRNQSLDLSKIDFSPPKKGVSLDHIFGDVKGDLDDLDIANEFTKDFESEKKKQKPNFGQHDLFKK